eukprot:9481764-Pyramimonas_sp.AAC.2
MSVGVCGRLFWDSRGSAGGELCTSVTRLPCRRRHPPLPPLLPPPTSSPPPLAPPASSYPPPPDRQTLLILVAFPSPPCPAPCCSS